MYTPEGKVTIELAFEESISLGVNVKRKINDNLSEKKIKLFDYDFRLWVIGSREAKIGDPEKTIIGTAVLSRSYERMELEVLIEGELVEELEIIF